MTQEALQYELFTGQLVDNGTREQKQRDGQRALPQQTELFPQRELMQYANPHPMMDGSPGPLVLISEDQLTLEEKERDLQRAAEQDTSPLFSAPFVATPLDEARAEPSQVIEVNPKQDAYAKLVEVNREQASLVNPRPVTQLEYSLLLALTKHEAKEAGLTDVEITAAILVGKHMGTLDQRRYASEQKPAVQQKQHTVTPFEPEVGWLGSALIQSLAPSRF